MMNDQQQCSICKKISSDELYTNMPCKCSIYCKSCAMKQATGGKCKICKQFFSQMKCLVDTSSSEKRNEDIAMNEDIAENEDTKRK